MRTARLRRHPRGLAARTCQCDRPRPVATKTSQARCTRIGLFRSIRRVGRRILLTQTPEHPWSSPADTAWPWTRRTSGGIAGMSEQPAGQRGEVEAGAADDDRPQSGATGVGDGRRRPGAAIRRPSSVRRHRRHGRRAGAARAPNPRRWAARSGCASRHRPAPASALITQPPSRSASASARADLPLAVGPAIRTGRRWSIALVS